MMGKVFVFLADGFEEIEGLTVVDMLRRAEIQQLQSLSEVPEISLVHIVLKLKQISCFMKY